MLSLDYTCKESPFESVAVVINILIELYYQLSKLCDRIYHFKTIGPRSIKSPVELIKWSAGTRARIDQILQINLELFYINSLYQRLITTNIFYRHEQSTEEESSQFAAQGE